MVFTAAITLILLVLVYVYREDIKGWVASYKD